MWILSALSLIKGNAKLFSYAAAIIAVFLVGWHLRGKWDEGKLEDALKAQETALVAKCADDKKLTEESTREYSTKVSDLSRKLADAKRLYKTSHNLPVAGAPVGVNRETPGSEHVGSNVGSPESFIDYAGTCEKLRLQVISMQEFEDKVWKH